MLTPGQAHDVQGFAPLFRMIGDRIEAFLADRGYDADAIREEIAAAGVEAVIPAKANRRTPAPHDRVKYRWRNLGTHINVSAGAGDGVTRAWCASLAA